MIARSHGDKSPFRPLVLDLVIDEESCNLSCTYCLTGQSSFKPGHELQRIFEPPRVRSCASGTVLHHQLCQTLLKLEYLQAPIVKISGGEVTLIRGIFDFLEECSALFETVVLLTNGALLTQNNVTRLLRLGNVVLQLSLDSTRYEGNSYRVGSVEVHQALVERILRVLETGVETEIYLVINDRSIETIEETLTDLLPFSSNVKVFPFPVRGPARDTFFPRDEQILSLFERLDRHGQYGQLLPFPNYLERLRAFLTNKERHHRCHLPRFAVGAFEDGTVTTCPNIWFDKVGNAITDDTVQLAERIEQSPLRRLLLAESPRIDACKACFTPWELLSLYCDNAITLGDITSVPVYRGPKARERLEVIKRNYSVECT